jgi:hypothetical protein
MGEKGRVRCTRPFLFDGRPIVFSSGSVFARAR